MSEAKKIVYRDGDGNRRRLISTRSVNLGERKFWLIFRSNKHLICRRLILSICPTRLWLLYRKSPSSRMLYILRSLGTWSGRSLVVDHYQGRRRTVQWDSTHKGKPSSADRKDQANNKIASPAARRFNFIPLNIIHPLPSQLFCR